MAKSPCINVCVIDEDVCIGCGRTRSEITKWTKMSDEQKTEVLERLKTFVRKPRWEDPTEMDDLS